MSLRRLAGRGRCRRGRRVAPDPRLLVAPPALARLEAELDQLLALEAVGRLQRGAETAAEGVAGAHDRLAVAVDLPALGLERLRPDVELLGLRDDPLQLGMQRREVRHVREE